MDSQRHYWRRYLYAEYEQACEREGFRAYSFNSFCHELLAWRKQARAEQTGEWYPAERATTYWSTIGKREGRLDLFVAQLTSSDMTFCLASKGRSYRDWMRCCAAAYEYFGGVPYVTCCPYPSLSRDGAATLEAFAAHFRTVLYGARPKSMKTAVRRGGLLDEKGSSFVASHVRADFAHVAFRSEDDANALIVGRADLYNSTSFGGEPSRRALFEEAEAELLLLLPEGGYGFDRWARRTVQRDHHFLYGRVRYSVPFRYAFEEVRIRIAGGAIEAYHMGELVARHAMPGKGSTARTVAGQMSVIGPRPVVEEELAAYGDDAGELLSAKSGITGWWQVQARNDATYGDGSRQELELSRGGVSGAPRRFAQPLRGEGLPAPRLAGAPAPRGASQLLRRPEPPSPQSPPPPCGFTAQSLRSSKFYLRRREAGVYLPATSS